MGMNKKEIWRVASVLLLGQLVSLLSAVTSFTASYIADLGVDLPLTQALSVYFSQAVVYGFIFLYRRQRLLVPWYWYIVLAILDVQANYLVITAYQYTSITSVTLLRNWTIPWVIILTWLFLRTRYSLCQLLGAALCVTGLVLVLSSDAGGRNPLLGDALIITATFCFALSFVEQEFCVKRKDLVEVLAMLGIFGGLVIVCEISVFERKDLPLINWSPTLIVLFTCYAATSFLISTIATFLLKMSGATLLNLSFLTANMWAVLIRIFFYKKQVDWLYYLAFSVAAVGLIVYSLNDATFKNAAITGDEEANGQYISLLNEAQHDRAEVVID